MNNINEDISKKDIRLIKSLIRSEIEDISHQRKFKKDIINIIKDEFKFIDNLDPDTQEKFIENIFKDMLQSYHDMFYRNRNIIKNKLSK